MSRRPWTRTTAGAAALPAADGRLHTIPTKHAKLLVVLDHLAQSFEPGRHYPEKEVNAVLERLPPRLRRAAPLPRRGPVPHPRGRRLLAQRRHLRCLRRPARPVGRTFRGEDWYAEDLGAARFVECTFTDVDLSETTTAGALFDRCTFHGCRFNASTHRSSAFVACDFRRASFFDATFEGCKLLGSVFAECTLRPIKVLGGQWHGVTIRGTNLTKLDLAGLDLREADLSLSDLTGSVLRDARLDGATLRETNLSGADLRGASLDGVDLAAARLRRPGSTWPAPCCSPSCTAPRSTRLVRVRTPCSTQAADQPRG